MLTDLTQLLQLPDLFQALTPHVGVGGGIEAREHIAFGPLLVATLLFLAGIGALFGLGLAVAAKKFTVTIDPRVEQVKAVLAHAHCGACGFAGCEQYAEAVVRDPNVPPNLCIPAGSRAADLIATLMGKKAEAREQLVARIVCQGGLSASEKKCMYEGVHDCRAVMLAGGDKACRYGCLGYGTCARVCPFGAIRMSDDHLPLVDAEACTGCRKCEAACPVKVIEVVPASALVLVACHSRDKGGETRKHCRVGCIACTVCVKICPFDAASISENLSRIDPRKCTRCGLCVRRCPTNAIKDFLPLRPPATVLDHCTGCGICGMVCPVNAVSCERGRTHTVDPSRCIGCGLCAVQCPVSAISGTFNALGVSADTNRTG